MSGVVGSGSGMGYGGNNYGGYSNDSKYESYDSKSYGKNSSKAESYGLSNPFGEYSYNKSTLDKYKGSDNLNKSATNPSTTPNFTTQKKPSIVPTSESTDAGKKPFSKLAPKLIKPPSKTDKPSPAQTKKVEKVQEKKITTNVMDDDIFDITTPSNPSTTEQKSNSTPFSFDDQPVSQPTVQKVEPVEPAPQKT